MKSTKIIKELLFVLTSEKAASARVRAINLIGELERHNIHCRHVIYPDTFPGKLRLLALARRADVTMLQKKLPTALDATLLAAASRHLVFDFDDAIYYRNQHGVENGSFHSKSRELKFARIARKSDLVIAGNEYLAAAARTHQPNTLILPSPVAVTGVPEKSYDTLNPIPVIGWVGSKDTLKYLEGIKSLLVNVHSQHPFQIHVISNGHFDIPGIECRNIPWRLETQDMEIAQFDIGIMPLTDDPWARGKCAYKLLQYMAAGVPFVASAVGMNVEVAFENTTGYAVADDQEFCDALLWLLNDPGLRADMGSKGRYVAEKHYSIEAVAGKLAEAIHDLTEKKS